MLLQPNPLLWTAIENRRMIRFAYHGKNRIAGAARSRNPQRLSPIAGVWQVDGSSSRPLPNWILMKANEITDLELLDQTFPGGRPTASGKHLKWDMLFIRVKPATDHLQAGSPRNPPPGS